MWISTSSSSSSWAEGRDRDNNSIIALPSFPFYASSTSSFMTKRQPTRSDTASGNYVATWKLDKIILKAKSEEEEEEEGAAAVENKLGTFPIFVASAVSTPFRVSSGRLPFPLSRFPPPLLLQLQLLIAVCSTICKTDDQQRRRWGKRASHHIKESSAAVRVSSALKEQSERRFNLIARGVKNKSNYLHW